MTPVKRGLGRGLDALIASTAPAPSSPSETAPAEGLIDVDPRLVDPNPEQPRHDFDPRALSALGESIRLHGLLHPIVVEAKDDGRYQLVAGERRLRASTASGVASIPAIVRPAAESGRQALELALTENLLRADLNPLDEATAYSRLSDVFGLSHDAIAQRLGSARPTVSNAIRLLQLSAPVQTALREGRLSAGHARALLAVPDPELQASLAAKVEAEGLSVRATEELVRRAQTASKPAGGRPAAKLSPDDEYVRRGLENAVGLPVKMTRRGKGGSITIDFQSDEDLGGLYSKFGGRPL